jgi:XTP/dITP diphosphohydrolase
MLMKLCFATNNTNKLAEIQALLGDAFELVTLQDIGCTDEIPEPFHTIPLNSEAKAQYIWDHYHINCFADDTGLVIPALDGQPGVDSAHYAGPERNAENNMNLVLKNLAPHENKKAYFLTVITLIIDGEKHQFTGKVEGEIIQYKRGDQGFGYDPIFQPTGSDKTFAEMTMEEKGKLSHRGRAFAQLEKFLKSR